MSSKTPEFIAWLLVNGFLVETPYPKTGDWVCVHTAFPTAVSCMGTLTKQGHIARPSDRGSSVPISSVPGVPRFYIALDEGEAARLHERYTRERRTSEAV